MGNDVTQLIAAISALFTALMLAMKVRGDDWKELYTEARQELKAEKAEHAGEVRENNRLIGELGHSVSELVRGQQEMDRQLRDMPKRKEDWSRRTGEPAR